MIKEISKGIYNFECDECGDAFSDVDISDMAYGNIGCHNAGAIIQQVANKLGYSLKGGKCYCLSCRK